MKKALLAVFITLTPFALIGCNDGSWSDYNTPTRFLKKAANSSHRFTIGLNDTEPKMSSHKDYNLEVRNALIKAGNFKKSEHSSSDSSRCFYYVSRHSDGYIGLAPALYCVMSVYDDGFIKIDFEEIKEHKYAYFEMDAEKAYEINDLVYAKIPKEKQMQQEDRSKAYQDGDVVNFISAMEKKSSIRTKVNAHNKDGTYCTFNFNDKGDLLDLIKNIDYERTSNGYPLESEIEFVYNVYSSTDGDSYWTYSLYGSGDYVNIYYSYKDRLGDINHVSINYSIDAAKGKEVLTKALEIATK